MTDQAKLQDGLLQVRMRFLDALNERERDLEALLAEIRSTGTPGPSRDAAHQQLHRMAGTAPTLGLTELGRLAALGDDALQLVKQGRAYDAGLIAALLRDVLGAIADARAAAAEAQTA